MDLKTNGFNINKHIKIKTILDKSIELSITSVTDNQTIIDLLDYSAPETHNMLLELTIILIYLFNSLKKGSVCAELSIDKFILSLDKLVNNEMNLDNVLNNFIDNLNKFSSIISFNEEEYKPIVYILNKDKIFLFFRKYFFYNKSLNELLIHKSTLPVIVKEKIHGIRKIEKMIADSELNEKQKQSVILSMNNYLTIISGGPGTGKTSIVYYLIKAFLISGISPDKINLAAPTGRAGKRLTESIHARLVNENDSLIKDGLKSIEAGTIHRMLKYSHTKNKFFYDEENKLPAEIIIIDELSMVDIGLMTQLMQSIKSNTKIILLGDKNQLPSVDAGYVFAGLIPENKDKSNLNKCIIILDKNYRSNRAILKIAEKINTMDISVINELTKIKLHTNINYFNNLKNNCYLADDPFLKNNFYKILENWAYYYFFAKTSSYKTIINNIKKIKISEESINKNISFFDNLFRLIENTKILCVIKQGLHGVTGINKYLNNLFREQISIHNNKIFSGMPIIIRENDYSRNLFNGDCGVIIKDSDEGFKAVFRQDNEYTCFPIDFLPAYDTAFAITVHKSQGAEYNDVLIVLPGNEKNPLLTKEILYTGITRAKNNVIIVTNQEILEKCIQTKIDREPGIF